jgi:hypothetical protein
VSDHSFFPARLIDAFSSISHATKQSKTDILGHIDSVYSKHTLARYVDDGGKYCLLAGAGERLFFPWLHATQYHTRDGLPTGHLSCSTYENQDTLHHFRYVRSPASCYSQATCKYAVNICHS